MTPVGNRSISIDPVRKDSWVPSLYSAALDKHATETFSVGIDGMLTYINDSGAALLGCKREFSGASVSEFFEGPTEATLAAIRRCAGSSEWQPLTLTLSGGPHGGLAVALRGRGILNPDTGTLQVLIVGDPERLPVFAEHRRLIRELNQKLADQRSASLRLDSALENETRLHQELIHRVKNNLTLLNSLIRVRASTSTDPAVKAALREIESRVLSIALVHEILDKQNEIDVVDGHTLIDRLCEQMETSICPEGVTIARNLEPYRLHVSEATPLCLLVNELVTNSLKHAFEDREGGVVDVSLKRNGVDKLEVHIADNGKGFDAQNGSVGSGSRIVTALAEQLGADLTVSTDGGTKWQLVFAPQAVDSRAA